MQGNAAMTRIESGPELGKRLGKKNVRRCAGVMVVSGAALMSGCDGSDAMDRATGDDLIYRPSEPGAELGRAPVSGGTSSAAPMDPLVAAGADAPGVPGSGDGDAAGTGTGNGNGNAEPGTLTAGAWDDNRNLERFLEYRADLHARQMPGLPSFTVEEHEAAANAASATEPRVTLDVALVIDTTGSMGDELQYLQAEFDALSLAIESDYPEAEQRWALVVYRDTGDAYVARPFDFEPSAAAFRESLEAQSSDGGGDFPEASHAALAAMNELSWRSGAAARLAFWVADAPHHAARAADVAAAVRRAGEQGIHLYPVASSGVDELAELTMRSAAQLTLGRYLFLTDDSGVGGEHKEPSIPCYFVTRLDDAILRMIDIEMTGTYREPSPSDVIRAGGNPAEGACTLESGQTVFAF